MDIFGILGILKSKCKVISGGYFSMLSFKSTLLSALSLFSLGKTEAVTRSPLLVNHVNLIGELKEHFARKEQKPPIPARTNKTPTLSYLKAIDEGKLPYQAFWGQPKPADVIKSYRKDYKEIVDLAIDREQQFCNDYYVFYHGLANSFNVFQDFLKEFNGFLHVSGKKIDFEFLRMWQEAEKKIDANEWLSRRPGYVINTLIFVNLSLFGNLQNNSSHTFGYFKDNVGGNTYLPQSLLSRLFSHYGLNSSYLAELINLNQKYATNEGSIIQFFIPKDKVDQYVYLGGGSATTYRSPIVPSVWDSKLGYHTKIAPILDKYINDTGSISGFDNLQACILSSQDFLLSPNQDIKMFKYTTIKDNDLQNYKQEFKNICDKIFTEWIQKKTHKNLDATRLGRLIDLMK